DELSNQGYDVQPEGRRNPDFADELIRGDLERALLSVHLLGGRYDPFVERQIRLAAELEYRLLFWRGPGADCRTDARQAELIETLRNGQRPDRPGAALPAGWNFLPERGPLHLIEEVLASLKPKPTAAAPPPANGGISRI